MNILVVEDDPDIRGMVCQALAQNGYAVDSCASVRQARQKIEALAPDCLVVDWMLPDASGIELIRWLRRQQQYQQTPVLMLTARAQEQDKITGLESGADDYLTKPMSLRELNARVKALLRRPASYREASEVIAVDRLQINLRSHEVSIDNVPIECTRTEYKLLKLFLSNPNKVFSREQILNAVWGVNAYLGDRTVDVHILRLRKLLKPSGLSNQISTVRGSGYRFSKKR